MSNKEELDVDEELAKLLLAVRLLVQFFHLMLIALSSALAVGMIAYLYLVS